MKKIISIQQKNISLHELIYKNLNMYNCMFKNILPTNNQLRLFLPLDKKLSFKEFIEVHSNYICHLIKLKNYKAVMRYVTFAIDKLEKDYGVNIK